MLRIENLHAVIDGHEVLKGINLKVGAGEVHAIMGPNGSGKSTLAKIIAGHPAYKITEGIIGYEVNFSQRDLLKMAPDERAKEGIFLAFQYPTEIPGVSNFNFLKTVFDGVCKHHGTTLMDDKSFRQFVIEKAKKVDLDPSFLERAVNEGFSGGEKKRNEILQMAVLSPRLALLDETDSGLDIDSLKIVARGINELRTPENAMILITHYQRLLDYVQPDFVHVLADGRIVESGDKSLALKLEEKGYDWVFAQAAR